LEYGFEVREIDKKTNKPTYRNTDRINSHSDGGENYVGSKSNSCKVFRRDSGERKLT